MKCGKSSDDDGIQAEHILNAPFNVLTRVTTLFNFMLNHAFVPNQFHLGTIIPIIKDRQGKDYDTNNYRGITISPILSKLLEHTLKITYGAFLELSEYQFGYKKKRSTSHALFCLKETINYYIDRGSRVYCSFLDASKAFDWLVHSGLFIRLMEREIPVQFLRLLISWYGGLMCRVKWDGHLSNWFAIKAGVRQGGVLSPDLYSIYVDDLITKLKHSGAGCHIQNVFAAALLYADDIAIMAPSLRGLQKLLDLCGNFCTEWDIRLNPNKTKNMRFGKPTQINFDVKLSNVSLEWINEWKYLGAKLRSGRRFDCTVLDTVKKFYRALNSILRVDGRSGDVILLQLIETHCLPILTYAIEVLHVSNRDENRSLRVAYNSIFRKIFGYRIFESVTELQHALGRKTWEELIEKRKRVFVARLLMKNNPDSFLRVIANISPMYL